MESMDQRERKYLIDMDIGDDIDDAIALYAAMQRRFDLVGVTTVFRNTVKRANIAKKLLTLYGHGYENVPVYSGHGVPLSEKEKEYDSPPHYIPEIDSYHPDGTDPDDAVDFIIRSCRMYRSNLTIIAIGPFTNLAKALQRDTEALGLCGQISIMGGAFFKQYADWNIMCDVEAADQLFRNLNNLICLGADVTHFCAGDSLLYDALLNYTGSEPARHYLGDLCKLWQKDRPEAKLLLHDPLVVYNLAVPTLCQMEPATVAVIPDGFARGMSLNVDAYGKMWMNPSAYAEYPLKKCRVAKTVDVKKFLEMMHADFSKD